MPIALAFAFVVLYVSMAWAQAGVVNGSPTSSHEAITVSSSAIGITANLCGSGNKNIALVQVLTNDVYASFYSASATPGSSDFKLTAGTFVVIQPANRLRMIRVTSDATAVVQCYE